MTGNIIIIGSGLAGLGASYALNEKGVPSIVLEKDKDYGGLCSNFTIAGGFRFDRFVHFSFTKDDRINGIFRNGSPEIYAHTPNPYNLYRGIWIKHPAQNNLYPLPEDEKSQIIADFQKRLSITDTSIIKNYEQWLRIQYGDSFAERFPMAYTPKYWMCEACDLETKWVGQRLYQPSIDEVIQGANTSETPVTYYAKEMRYPSKGGFKQFLKTLAENADIRYDSEVVEIDVEKKHVKTSNGDIYSYDRIISSMPLPLLIKTIKQDIPDEIKNETCKLRCTSGYIISIALRGKNIPPYLWWYIYDKDILPARVYSPSLKSPDNAPEGCSSLQLEVYCHKEDYTEAELYNNSVNPLINLGIINKDDIIAIDIRFEPWANVIFDHNIYTARATVLDYVRSVGIEPIGRFGLWDYLWSDQALLSGLNIQ